MAALTLASAIAYAVAGPGVATPAQAATASQAWQNQPLLLAQNQARAKASEAKKPETRRIGSFHGWQAYQLDGRDGRTCYLHGLPEKKEPANARRGEIYLLVTHKPAKKVRNEVSIVFGYPLKPESAAEAVIGKDSVAMFTHEEAAWAADAETDARLVEALKKGNRLVVKGESARGTKTTDTYDLSGFTEAMRAIDRACTPGGGAGS